MKRNSLDAFQRAYVEAALWSSTDNSDDSGGEPLDKNYSVDDISAETLDQMIADCDDFREQFGELLDASGIDDEQAGHELWMSSNGHGSGFFDADSIDEEFQEKLQDAAQSFGGFDLYIGDDGEIHGTGYRKRGGAVGERRGVVPVLREHQVSDFDSPEDLIDHARQEGATHVLDGAAMRLYFPHADHHGYYEEATVYREHGYLHVPAKGDRHIVSRLPHGAVPIESRGRRSRGGRKAAENNANETYTSRQGTHGTLYLYEVKYTDTSDDGIGELSQRLWGYNTEHVEEKFYQAEDAGWKIISIARVPEGGGSMHRARKHMRAGSSKYETWKQEVIGHVKGASRTQAERAFDRREEEMRARFRNGEPASETAYALNAGMREPPRVRDYAAVDRNDRQIAGPYRNRHDAEKHIGVDGHVKFVPSGPKPKRAPPPPSSVPMFREGSEPVMTPQMLEILLHGMGEHASGKVPRAGDSLVYDRAYTALREGGYIVLKRATEGLSSFGDYFVLTDKGSEVINRRRATMSKIVTPKAKKKTRRRK